jgi:hypothetical protein
MNDPPIIKNDLKAVARPSCVNDLSRSVNAQVHDWLFARPIPNREVGGTADSLLDPDEHAYGLVPAGEFPGNLSRLRDELDYCDESSPACSTMKIIDYLHPNSLRRIFPEISSDARVLISHLQIA